MYIVPGWSSYITAQGLLLNEHMKKYTYNMFIFILPTPTLRSIFTHFLFNTERKEKYIYIKLTHHLSVELNFGLPMNVIKGAQNQVFTTNAYFI